MSNYRELMNKLNEIEKSDAFKDSIRNNPKIIESFNNLKQDHIDSALNLKKKN